MCCPQDRGWSLGKLKAKVCGEGGCYQPKGASRSGERGIDGITACGAHDLALQQATATISSAAQGTGPGEGPGKHSTWAVARAGGLGTSRKLLQLVREGDTYLAGTALPCF